VLAGGLASGARAESDNLPPCVPEWMKTPGDPMGTLDAGTLAAIKMPNRDHFTGDTRPDVKNPACMS
jgi:hypothetical protein